VNAAVQHQELLPILFWKLFRKDSLMLRRTLSSGPPAPASLEAREIKPIDDSIGQSVRSAKSEIL
jgi:hypothetical protein